MVMLSLWREVRLWFGGAPHARIEGAPHARIEPIESPRP